MPSFSIRPERADDLTAIATLQSAAFQGDPVIPDLIADLRALDTPVPTRSLVACDSGDRPVGHVMLSHGWLDAPDRLIDIAVLSPLGVHPERQGEGVGTALVAAAIEAARDLGVPMLFLEGNPRFYGPRGFEAAGPLGIRRPSHRIPAAAFQTVRLPGWSAEMTGTLVYRDLFWARDAVGLRP